MHLARVLDFYLMRKAYLGAHILKCGSPDLNVLHKCVECRRAALSHPCSRKFTITYIHQFHTSGHTPKRIVNGSFTIATGVLKTLEAIQLVNNKKENS